MILNINPIVLVNCKNKPGWSLCNERFTKTQRPPASEVPAVRRGMCRVLFLLLRRLCRVLETETQALLFLPLLVVLGDAGKWKKEKKAFAQNLRRNIDHKIRANWRKIFVLPVIPESSPLASLTLGAESHLLTFRHLHGFLPQFTQILVPLGGVIRPAPGTPDSGETETQSIHPGSPAT